VKTTPAALATHQASGSTTLAWCWKVTRKDGQVFGYTSVDKDLLIDGITYKAATGFTPSAVEGHLNLSVANLEVAGVLDDTSITEADLLAGRWDGAAVEIFEVNHANLSQGRMIIRVGTLGSVSTGAQAFTAEARGLAQALQQSVGETYAAACSATLGDTRCGVNTAAITVAGTVTATSSHRNFTDTSRGEADDFFGAGLVTWQTGANTGLSMEVAGFSGGAFTLHLPMPYPIAVGDTYQAIPGCRKRRTEDCSAKFSNAINFRGFPDAPMNDAVIGLAGVARE
jgi:uncharacterized phage protein (TIGR02218 family)